MQHEQEKVSLFDQLKNSVTLKRLKLTLPIWHQIEKERQAQDAKWGQQDHDPIVWMAILTEEVGEAAQAALQAHLSFFHANNDNAKYEADQLVAYRKELVQIAAVMVAMIECIDRNHFGIE